MSYKNAYQELSHLRNFLGGLTNFYQNFNQRALPYEVIVKEGSTRILLTSIAEQTHKRILLIPSLINKSYIFDLEQNNSLINFLRLNGFSVYIIDFTEPLNNEQDLGFEEFLTRILNLINQIKSLDKFFCLGYCLGSSFASEVAKILSDRVIGQIHIAPPGDFKQYKSLLEKYDFIRDCLLTMSCNLPGFMVQNFFYLTDPIKVLKKYSHFFQDNMNYSKELFLGLENWVHDGLSLTKKFVCDIFRVTNQEQSFSVKNNVIPAMIVIGNKDRIVNRASSDIFMQNFLSKETFEYQASHVELVVGNIAKEKIWPDIVNWCNRRLDN